MIEEDSETLTLPSPLHIKGEGIQSVRNASMTVFFTQTNDNMACGM